MVNRLIQLTLVEIDLDRRGKRPAFESGSPPSLKNVH
jgi:hypothetical protein